MQDAAVKPLKLANGLASRTVASREVGIRAAEMCSGSCFGGGGWSAIQGNGLGGGGRPESFIPAPTPAPQLPSRPGPSILPGPVLHSTLIFNLPLATGRQRQPKHQTPEIRIDADNLDNSYPDECWRDFHLRPVQVVSLYPHPHPHTRAGTAVFACTPPPPSSRPPRRRLTIRTAPRSYSTSTIQRRHGRADKLSPRRLLIRPEPRAPCACSPLQQQQHLVPVAPRHGRHLPPFAEPHPPTPTVAAFRPPTSPGSATTASNVSPSHWPPGYARSLPVPCRRLVRPPTRTTAQHSLECTVGPV